VTEYTPSLTPRPRTAGPITAPRLSPAEVKAYLATRRARVQREHSVDPSLAAAGYGVRTTADRPVPRRNASTAPSRGVVTGGGGTVPVLRSVIGEELRRLRTEQGRTLRDVSAAARVSLGYLSEVERGQKEASSELLGSICQALEVPLSVVLRLVSDEIAQQEATVLRPASVSVIPDISRNDTVASAA